MLDSPYLRFERRQPPGRKTPIVKIVAKSSNHALGEIRWFGRWRQFCFFPSSDTVFNTGCMTVIQAQIQELMDERKQAACELSN